MAGRMAIEAVSISEGTHLRLQALDGSLERVWERTGRDRGVQRMICVTEAGQVLLNVALTPPWDAAQVDAKGLPAGYKVSEYEGHPVVTVPTLPDLPMIYVVGWRT